MYFKMNTSYSLVSQFDFSTTIFEEKYLSSSPIHIAIYCILWTKEIRTANHLQFYMSINSFIQNLGWHLTVSLNTSHNYYIIAL